MSKEQGFDRAEHMRKVREKGQLVLKEKREAAMAIPEEELPLNPKQQEFCRLYVMEAHCMGNAAKSYAEAYQGGAVTNSTYAASSELLKKENVKAEIKQLEEQRLKAYEHIRYSNIETLVKIRDEMVTAIVIGRDGESEASPHLSRQTAIKSVEVLNKMLGFNKQVDSGQKGGGNQFIFNLIPPTAEDEPDTTVDIDFEEEGD